MTTCGRPRTVYGAVKRVPHVARIWCLYGMYLAHIWLVRGAQAQYTAHSSNSENYQQVKRRWGLSTKSENQVHGQVRSKQCSAGRVVISRHQSQGKAERENQAKAKRDQSVVKGRRAYQARRLSSGRTVGLACRRDPATCGIPNVKRRKQQARGHSLSAGRVRYGQREWRRHQTARAAKERRRVVGHSPTAGSIRQQRKAAGARLRLPVPSIGEPDINHKRQLSAAAAQSTTYSAVPSSRTGWRTVGGANAAGARMNALPRSRKAVVACQCGAVEREGIDGERVPVGLGGAGAGVAPHGDGRGCRGVHGNGVMAPMARTQMPGSGVPAVACGRVVAEASQARSTRLPTGGMSGKAGLLGHQMLGYMGIPVVVIIAPDDINFIGIFLGYNTFLDAIQLLKIKDLTLRYRAHGGNLCFCLQVLLGTVYKSKCGLEFCEGLVDRISLVLELRGSF
ncbi:hypothetical protein GGX14DRAFT_608426 [Mycena pura]|uniref:Uncharacterized protein n=1 Tax=Mycena pura TaxID=153505 RepID=A0AAD6VL71_9AGAR|nr:hypothetical protein GGX14DRAFT_608426 [Mycena pura]